jgi:hypothetical protein
LLQYAFHLHVSKLTFTSRPGTHQPKNGH